MKPGQTTLDVSNLPTTVFGSRGTGWWGTLGFMVIEGTTLFICVITYLYLYRNFEGWPPLSTPEPDLLLPTISAALLVGGILPAIAMDKGARKKDLKATRRALVLEIALAMVVVALRAFEFGALNVRYDSNAYGSIVWFTIGFHSTLLLIDLIETMAIAAIFFIGPVEEKHFVDASDDAFYTYFIATIWIPLYAVLYLSPRFL